MRIWPALLLLVVACGSEPPPPPPPPPTPTPKASSLIPTLEKLKSMVNDLNVDVADDQESAFVLYVNEPKSRENTITVLLEAASDPRPKVRAHVMSIIEKVLAFYKIRDERLADAALKLINDPDPWVQTKAFDALGKLCSKKAVPILMAEMTNKKNPLERIAGARQALARMAGLDRESSNEAVKKWWAQNEATFDEKKCQEQPFK